MNIVLIGLKNAGKTTNGTKLSQEKGLEFLDTDDLVLKEYNKIYNEQLQIITDVHAQLGEKKFREIELSEIVRHRQVLKTVLATGGGSIIIPECLSVLKEIGEVIYLYLSEGEFIKRIMSDKNTYLRNKDLPEMYNYRHPICQNMADHVIDVSNSNIEESYNKIKDCLF